MDLFVALKTASLRLRRLTPSVVWRWQLEVAQQAAESRRQAAEAAATPASSGAQRPMRGDTVTPTVRTMVARNPGVLHKEQGNLKIWPLILAKPA